MRPRLAQLLLADLVLRSKGSQFGVQACLYGRVYDGGQHSYHLVLKIFRARGLGVEGGVSRETPATSKGLQ